MASISVEINISGQGVTSDTLSLSSGNVLTVQSPVREHASMSVTNIAKTIFTGHSTKRTYLYVKNIGNSQQPMPSVPDILILEGSNTKAQIGVNEFCFIPVDSGDTYKLQTASGTIIPINAEYSYFTANT